METESINRETKKCNEMLKWNLKRIERSAVETYLESLKNDK